MYNMLKHAHSGIRWILLILLIYAVFNAYTKWKGNNAYQEKDRKLNLFTFIATHVQLLLGLGLYFISPKVQFTGEVMKNAVGRFYTVEHLSLMLIAVILITVGNIKSKKMAEDGRKFKTVFTYFAIALLLILISIPWPFRAALGGSWF